MASRIVTKVISAAAIALIVELADLGLDKLGLTDKKYRVVRKVLKSGIGAASSALIGKVLNGADEATADESGADEAGADEAGADEAGADEAGADEAGAEQPAVELA
jgi:hypothetical protein